MEMAKNIGKVRCHPRPRRRLALGDDVQTGVLVGNCVGFTANRIFFPYGQAAAFLVDHGVLPYRIDKALLQFGMPMGMFAMGDLSGAVHSP